MGASWGAIDSHKFNRGLTVARRSSSYYYTIQTIHVMSMLIIDLDVDDVDDVDDGDWGGGMVQYIELVAKKLTNHQSTNNFHTNRRL
jgi:hypothetical protein